MRNLICPFLLIVLLALVAGCGGAGQSSVGEKPASPSAETIAQTPVQVPPAQIPPDTIDATVRSTQPPAVSQPVKQEERRGSTTMPIVKYGVQIGAYTQTEVAEDVANRARARFPVKLQTIQDEKSRMMKIFLGEFASKDDARKFRDSIVRQFPGEYEDAWVSEIPVR